MKRILYTFFGIALFIQAFFPDEPDISALNHLADPEPLNHLSPARSPERPQSRTVDTPTVSKTDEPKEWLFVTGSRVNIRKGPGTNYEILSQSASGDKLAVFETQKGWAKVQITSAGQSATGWISARYLSANEPQKPVKRTAQKPNKRSKSVNYAQARQEIIRRSIASYSGSCPCPYNRDRAGRRCGKRSAYSRPGGAHPKCYENDVTDAQVARFLASR